MRRMLMAATAAALLAGTTMASAQVYWDDPPGYAWQRRGVIDESGRNPNWRSYHGPYGAFAYEPNDSVVMYGPRRYVRPDRPPGSRFQDRGIDEDLGRSPLNRGR